MHNNPPQPYIEKRPWGEFMRFTLNEPTSVKILTIHAGEQLSVQYHNKRDEFWYVLSGTGVAFIGDGEQQLSPDTQCFVPRTTNHSIAAHKDMKVLEISYGEFDEQDIVRLQDAYGRVNT